MQRPASTSSLLSDSGEGIERRISKFEWPGSYCAAELRSSDSASALPPAGADELAYELAYHPKIVRTH